MEIYSIIILIVLSLIGISFFAILIYMKRNKINKNENTRSIIKTTNNTSYEPDVNNIFDYTGKIWRGNSNIK